MRARTDTKNAPAEPTTARMAVGFSGEFTQPPCAYSGRATEERRAMPANTAKVFFICVLNWEGTVTKVDCQRGLPLTENPFWCIIEVFFGAPLRSGLCL